VGRDCSFLFNTMNEADYKMGIGLPRGEKIIVKIGARQADISLDHEEFAWRVKIDRDLPETTYPRLENAIIAAQTLLREVT
jgi:hypothetical protein